MEPNEEINLENKALAAELARQLCHDFSNFVYNLYLQIEIGANSRTEPNQENWTALKKEAKKITRLLQEWDQFHNRFLISDGEIDLHEIIRQAAQDAGVHDHKLELAPGISESALRIVNSGVDCRHLVRLLIEDLSKECKGSAEDVPVISISTQMKDAKAIVHFTACELDAVERDGAGESLMGTACRSLAVRLGASLQRDHLAPGRLAVFIEFPLSQ